MHCDLNKFGVLADDMPEEMDVDEANPDSNVDSDLEDVEEQDSRKDERGSGA